MKWKGGGRVVLREVLKNLGRWDGFGALAMRTLLMLALLVQLTSCAVGAPSIEIFVPAERKENVGSVFRLTVDHSSSVDGRAVNGVVGGQLDAGYLRCCKSAELDWITDGGNRSHAVRCSTASGVVSKAAALGHGSVEPSGRCMYLLIDFSRGYGTGTSISGGSNDGYTKLQLDAIIVLSVYLGWISKRESTPTDVNEEAFLALLQTVGECPQSDEESSLCRLTVSIQTVSGISLSSGLSFEASASIELEPSVFRGMQMQLPQLLKVSFSLSSRTLSSVGSGTEFAGSSSSRPYLRGHLDSIVSPEANAKREFLVVTLYTSSLDVERNLLARNVENLQDQRSYTRERGVTAGVGYLGRRLLRASFGEASPSSSFRCEYGRLRCSQWVSLTVGAIVSLAGVSLLAILCAGSKDNDSPTDFLETVPSLPPRFSYSKLQKATKNFSRKLGDGAFGSVYEGSLPNGARVAVKMLEKTSVQGEKQFRAEVASMGAIRHLNLVRLHGFCSEGHHRLLVYEYMPNGSLDSWLFGKKQGEKILDWEQRLNIALGTARALAYLHEECSDHIIHLDVKPENILLDHQFCPKLSDFGLAKLMDREQSRVVTSMRGTPGYLAPEWLLPHAAVTAKTDVYSFGMVLLELISGRENTNFSLGKEQWYFPAWAFKLMGEGRTMELLDKRLHVEEVEYFHKKDAVRAIHCALLCIQDDPAARPPMSRVVHMLQGHVEPEPLNARQAAIQPPRRLLTAFAASMSDVDTKNTHTEALNNVRNDARNDVRNDALNDSHHQPVGLTTSTRLPVAESPRVKESPRVMNRLPSPRTLEDLEEEKVGHFERMEPLPPAVQVPNQVRAIKTGSRMAGAHSLSSTAKSIPPWPVKGDVILLRGPQGDMHGVVRDVRVQTKQMRLAILNRLSSETRWSVREEEQLWRQWSESVKTLDFWVVVRWSTIPGRGFEKYPVEWMTR